MKRLIIILLICFGIRGMEPAPLALEPLEHVPQIFNDLPKGVEIYLRSLPKIKQVDGDDPEAKSKAITDYLLLCGDYDQNIDGRDALEAKILKAIKNNKPIMRCMPGFPVSSANPNKIPFDDKHCFGMGDLVGLLTRNHISGEIGKIHKPGSSLAIYWEPFILAMNTICQDKLGQPLFSNERIIAYQNMLKRMITHCKPNIVPAQFSMEQINEIFSRNYANIEVQDKTKDYKAFAREDLDSETFIECSERIKFAQKREELEKIKKFASIKGKSFEEIKENNKSAYKKMKSELAARNYLESVSDEMAQTLSSGSQRMAILMEKEIPAYNAQIRESVRADTASVQTKIGIPIIFGVEGTPWHNVLVVKPNGVALAPYKLIKKEFIKRKLIAEDKEVPLTNYSVDGCELPYINLQ